jgi:hypothetical protein
VRLYDLRGNYFNVVSSLRQQGSLRFFVTDFRLQAKISNKRMILTQPMTARHFTIFVARFRQQGENW